LSAARVQAAEFKEFMFEQSQELPGSLDYVRSLAAAGRYRVSALNNESLELNEYRIRRFHLDDVFLDFFSSCYLQMVKPDEDIYRAVLAITRIRPEQAIFIDDRAVNVESALAAGYNAVRFPELAAVARPFGGLALRRDSAPAITREGAPRRSLRPVRRPANHTCSGCLL